MVDGTGAPPRVADVGVRGDRVEIVDRDIPYMTRLLARVEGMDLRSLEAGVPFDWSSFGDYLDRRVGRLAVNAGFLVGHNALRRAILGQDSHRAAAPFEVAEMVALLRRSLAEGGLGYSTSVSPFEHDGDGRPVPALLAAREEHLALAEETGRHDGTTLQFAPNAGVFTDETVELMIGMSTAANRPLNWNVIFVATEAEEVIRRRLAVSDLAAQRGAYLVGLVVPDSSALRVNFVSGALFDSLPVFEELMRLDHRQRLEVLASPAARQLLRQAADSPNGRAMYYMTNWGSFTISQTFSAANEGLTGRTVQDIANERGVDPFDCLLDIVVADELRTILLTTDRGADEMGWKLRREVLRDPRALAGGSDAGAHLDMLDTFNLSTGFLGPTVRDRKLLPLEQAVHFMTGAPARLLGLVDRGVVAEGSYADLFVFDPATLGPGDVEMRADLPAGGSRLYGEPTGVRHVFVNGVEIVDPNGVTGDLPGTVLRSGRDTSTVTNTDALSRLSSPRAHRRA